jgi:2-hydroxy-3-oxopropionate reductase
VTVPAPASSLSIGFLGTGTMGKPMVRNLLRHGFAVTVWNRTPQRYAELVAQGATAAASPRLVAARSDVVIAMLQDWSNLEALLYGPEGFARALRPGSLFIDMGTDPPDQARELARSLAQFGVAALDAPVSGGERGAIAGTLSIMVGGAEAAFERALPIFNALGRTVVHVGGPGSGQAAKACNQLVVAVTIEAVAEALALAAAFGADPAKVREAMRGGFAASRVLEEHGARMLARDWKPGAAIKLHLKDRDNVYAAARAAGLDLPAARLVFERIEAFVAAGGGELDQSALYTLLDRGATIS